MSRLARAAIAGACALACAAPASPALAAPPVVAVVDTGVDTGHRALRGHLWTNPGEVPGNGADDDGNGFADDVHGADVVGADGDPADVRGHGTHVAGIVALRGGPRGRPTGARLMPVRVLRRDGRGSPDALAAGIDYAVREGADVINLSVAGYGPDQRLRAALERAGDAGALVVVAAGNDGGRPAYPAAFRTPGMVVVAAARGRRIAGFSDRGADLVDLAAPGVRVLSTLPRGRWGYMTGSSQAAAAVSRAAARALVADPALDASALRATLLGTVRPAPATRGATATGGLLDLGRVLRALLG